MGLPIKKAAPKERLAIVHEENDRIYKAPSKDTKPDGEENMHKDGSTCKPVIAKACLCMGDLVMDLLADGV